MEICNTFYRRYISQSLHIPCHVQLHYTTLNFCHTQIQVNRLTSRGCSCAHKLQDSWSCTQANKFSKPQLQNLLSPTENISNMNYYIIIMTRVTLFFAKLPVLNSCSGLMLLSLFFAYLTQKSKVNCFLVTYSINKL